MKDVPASQQIDDIINLHSGWKGELVSQLRAAIKHADPDLEEEVKWKMANRPEGLPVWSHDGILCFAEIWKDNVKLLFPKGALLDDPQSLFNARLKSKTTRAIEFHEGDGVNVADLQDLIRQAARINQAK
jgi:hypothetical protein